MDYFGDEFRETLMEWFQRNRRSFYWRGSDLSPFQVLVTEMLLKRTRAEAVDNFGEEIIERLRSPDIVLELNRTNLASLLKPLGLQNRRAKNLVSACESIETQFGGEVPANRDELLKIPGVGEYIADGVLCFSFGKPVLVLDTNTIRVAEHYFGIEAPDDPRQDDSIRPSLAHLVPKDNPEEFNWGLIDLGARLREGDFTCPECPLNVPCRNYP